MANLGNKPSSIQDDFFLPDFCNVRMVLAVILIGELLALVLTLAPAQSQDRWQELGMVSLFIQWVALISATVLCLARRWLSTLNDYWAGTISYLLLIITTTVVSEFTHLTAQWISVGTLTTFSWHPDFLFRSLAISSIVSAVALRYFYLQFQWAKNMEAKSQARIQALQSRIRPHFLFNSLNTIATLTRINPQLAEKATEDLADLFRGSLATENHEVSLSEEWELARRYLHIEKLRMGDRLNIDWDIKDLPDDALLPQLSLQPLLENAIYHGLEHMGEGGTICIDGHMEQEGKDKNIVKIHISNPVSDYSRQQQSRGNKMAQENIKHRLSAVFGPQGRLETREEENMYHINISFPYIARNS